MAYSRKSEDSVALQGVVLYSKGYEQTALSGGGDDRNRFWNNY